MTKNKLLSFPEIPKENVANTIKDMVMNKTESVIFLDHAVMRLEERNITKLQVLQSIKNGDVDIPPKWDTEKERGWKCRFKGIGGGRYLKVAVKLVERPDDDVSLIITVFEE